LDFDSWKMASPSTYPDLTLYLVTDSTPAILGERDLCRVVEEAVKGGVTIVQYRDKHAETSDMITTAQKLHKITRKYQIPLLVNDRVDVASAVGAEGVHLGQDDMHISEARKILGDHAIIGVSVANMEEAENAFQHGADYLGVGTMFPTPTKTDTKSIIGTAGTRAILEAIAVQGIDMPCVAIGGIKSGNVQRVLYQTSSVSPYFSLAGLAVVSEIMGSTAPLASAQELRSLISTGGSVFYSPTPPNILPETDLSTLLSQIPSITRLHAKTNPLSHNMMNTVVQNFAANVCLAAGASPIMSPNGLEAADLAGLRGGLVINMGTLTPDSMQNYLLATAEYNRLGSPTVFDPVGGGGAGGRGPAVEGRMAGG